MAVWTLSVDGGEARTLEEWGINNVRRNLVSQGMDTVTFVADGKAFDGVADFSYGAQIQIKKDGVGWFYGAVIKVPRQASMSAESLSYTVAGPWYWLDQIGYKLVWQFRSAQGGNPVIVPLASTHLILNVSNGLIISTGDQITAAVAYAIFRGAPIQIGDVTPSLIPPLDEVRDITCGEVIRKMLRWHPSAVTWFDYSTQPYPTFHCRPASELTVARIAYPPANGNMSQILTPVASSVEINPLYELRRPAVCINYEQKNSINNREYVNLIQDIAPAGATGNEIGALTVTVDLMGLKQTTVLAELECAAVPDNGTDAEKLAWLQDHVEELKDPNIKDLTLTSWARKTGSNNYPNELVGGQIADWMEVDSEDDIVFVEASYRKVVDGEQRFVGTKRFKAKFKATNAVSGEYENSGVEEYGDPLPVGVAQYLYDQLSTLQYGGSFTLEEEELRVPAGVGIGNVVTFGVAPLHPEWLNMNALVQQVTEELDAGRTTITVGAPGRLGAQDLIELTRVNRARRRETPVDAITSGRIRGGGQVELGKRTANNVSGFNDPDMSFLMIRTPERSITLDSVSGLLRVEKTGAYRMTMEVETGTAVMETLAAGTANLGKVRIENNLGLGAIRVQETDGPGRSINIKLLDLNPALGDAAKNCFMQLTEVCENGQKKRAYVLRSGTFT